MRDPYQADDGDDAEMARIRARLSELERPGGAVPRELDELLHGDGAWRRGTIPLHGRPVLVELHGRAGLTTAADVLRYLEAPEATGPATGRIGPALRRALPPPLAGYRDGDLLVLADWLDKPQSRRVLRTLRRRPGRGTGERRLMGVVLLPVLLGMRALRDLGHTAATLSPAAGTATATCTATAGASMTAAVAPLVTCAALAAPASLPSMEGVFGPPIRDRAAVVRPAPASAGDPLGPPRPPSAGEDAEGAAAAAPQATPESAPLPAPAPVTEPSAPPPAPPDAPTAAPSPTPTSTTTPTPAPTQRQTAAEEPTATPTTPTATPTPTATTTPTTMPTPTAVPSPTQAPPDGHPSDGEPPSTPGPPDEPPADEQPPTEQPPADQPATEIARNREDPRPGRPPAAPHSA